MGIYIVVLKYFTPQWILFQLFSVIHNCGNIVKRDLKLIENEAIFLIGFFLPIR